MTCIYFHLLRRYTVLSISQATHKWRVFDNEQTMHNKFTLSCTKTWNICFTFVMRSSNINIFWNIFSCCCKNKSPGHYSKNTLFNHQLQHRNLQQFCSINHKQMLHHTLLITYWPGQILFFYFRGLLFTSYWLNLQYWTRFYIAVYGKFQGLFFDFRGLFFAFRGQNCLEPHVNFSLLLTSFMERALGEIVLTRAVASRRMLRSVRAEVKVVSLLPRASLRISTYAPVM